jgi:hypothetical protein
MERSARANMARPACEIGAGALRRARRTAETPPHHSSSLTQGTMRPVVRLYPLLLAAFPILALAGANPGEYSVPDLLTILAIALAATAFGSLALSYALRRGPPELAPAITALLVGWFFGFVPFGELVQRDGYSLTHPRALAALLTLAALGALYLGRRRLRAFTTFMTLTGALLVGQSLLAIGAGRLRGAREIGRSPTVAAFARPVAMHASAPHACTASKPDIYLIILDGYANADVLRTVYHFSNARFVDSLRTLGFRIPHTVRSNYTHTHLSLSSILNMGYVTGLRADLGPAASNPSVLNYLIENNRAAAFARREGYTFVFSPSSWWAATMGNRNAAIQLEPWPGFDLWRELGRTDLRRVLRDRTMLTVFTPGEHRPTDGRFILRSFDAMATVPGMAAPTFLVAHVLAPHYPYVLDADCHPLDPRAKHTEAHPWADRQAYLDQLSCLNRRVLALATNILERSSTPPVIILQGDHGSNTRDQANRLSPLTVTQDEAAERFGAFGAYYMPCGEDTAFAGVVTPVNVLRKVFSYYLGADLPSLPDSSYFSVTKRPYDFVRFVPQPDGSLSGPLPLQ